MAQVWKALMTLFFDRRDAMLGVLRQHGVTPPHAHALSVLLEEPRRMCDLAACMDYDASYITALVDRLQDFNMVERTSDPHDRRVKLIALTDFGRDVALQIQHAIATPPAEMRKLSRKERDALALLLAKIVRPGSEPDPFRKTYLGLRTSGTRSGDRR